MTGTQVSHPLIRFLTEELAVSHESIALANQYAEQTPTLLPIILWQYGLITTVELEQTFDWLERHSTVL